MAYYYSISTNGWYDTGFADYTLPQDAIKLSASEWAILRKDMNSGKKLSTVNGKLQWIEDENAPSETEIKTKVERDWRNLELERADKELFKVQDSDVKAVGSVAQWREYRKSLRAWPEHPSFPDVKFRPSAPDKE